MDTLTNPADTPTAAPDWATARELHRIGLTWQQITDRTGIPNGTLRKRSVRERWLRASAAVIVIQPDQTPALPRLHSDSIARHSEELRRLMVLDTLSAMERVTKRQAPRSNKGEFTRMELTRGLVAQAETVCGWSRQDQTSGAILVGFASQVLGDSKAIPEGNAAQVHDGQVQSSTGAG